MSTLTQLYKQATGEAERAASRNPQSSEGSSPATTEPLKQEHLEWLQHPCTVDMFRKIALEAKSLEEAAEEQSLNLVNVSESVNHKITKAAVLRKILKDYATSK